MKTRGPLDPLRLPEVPREPQTPWFWIIVTLLAGAVLLWMLLSLANQPEEGDVRGAGVRRDASPLDFASSRNEHRESPWEGCQRLRSIHPRSSEQG